MTKKEFDEMVRQMHKQGLNDDNIMGILIETFETKKCDINDLELMVSWLGYHLTDDFYKAHKLQKSIKK